MKIVVAGSSGFIGTAFVEKLVQSGHEVIALSRSFRVSTNPKVEFRKCDLFSLLDAEEGLKGGEVGVFLVHSMMPSAKLTQGSFQDLDLIIADNFARTAKKYNFRQILYLGGMVPGEEKYLSDHLKSRFEVQKTLRSYDTPVTSLQAGLVMGSRGSSFQILTKLILKSPVIFCPPWLKTLSQPIFLNDLLEMLFFCVGNSETYNRIFQIGGHDVISYKNLMKKVAKYLGKKRWFLPCPPFPVFISQIFMKWVTGAPFSLSRPLIHSLRFPMLARDNNFFKAKGLPFTSLDVGLWRMILELKNFKEKPKAFVGTGNANDSSVRSVQRLVKPVHFNAERVGKLYLTWLERLVPPLRVTIRKNLCLFYFWPIPKPLLILEYSEARSTSDRALFYIRGGVLVRQSLRGRLEFRETKIGDFILVAVHEFYPRLPWYIYRFTQAQLHVWIVKAFGFYLSEKDAE